MESRHSPATFSKLDILGLIENKNSIWYFLNLFSLHYLLTEKGQFEISGLYLIQLINWNLVYRKIECKIRKQQNIAQIVLKSLIDLISCKKNCKIVNGNNLYLGVPLLCIFFLAFLHSTPTALAMETMIMNLVLFRTQSFCSALWVATVNCFFHSLLLIYCHTLVFVTFYILLRNVGWWLLFKLCLQTSAKKFVFPFLAIAESHTKLHIVSVTTSVVAST